MISESVLITIVYDTSKSLLKKGVDRTLEHRRHDDIVSEAAEAVAKSTDGVSQPDLLDVFEAELDGSVIESLTTDEQLQKLGYALKASANTPQDHDYEELINKFLQNVEENLIESGNTEEEIEVLYQRIKETQDFARELDEEVDSLGAQVGKLSDVIDPEDAFDELSQFRQNILTEEGTLLGVSPEGIDIEELKNSYQGNEPQQIITSTVDHDITIIRGPHGTGKTTAGYIACDKLHDQDYEIILPKFDRPQNKSVIRREYSDADQSICFVQYKTGRYAFTENDIRTLFNWVKRDVCDHIFIECRRGRFNSLNNRVTESLEQDNEAYSRWEQKSIIDLHPFEKNSTQLFAVIEWALNQLTSSPDTETVREIAEFSEGNPEIAKIASKNIIQQNNSLEQFDEKEQLVWRDIAGTIRETEQRLRVFGLICIAGSVTTAEILSTLPSVSRGELQQFGEDLFGYLGGDVRDKITIDGNSNIIQDEDRWEISPDIYSDAILKYHFIEDGQSNFMMYLSNIIEAGENDICIRIAKRLRESHERAHNDDHKDALVNKAEVLVDQLGNANVSPTVFLGCVRHTINWASPNVDALRPVQEEGEGEEREEEKESFAIGDHLELTVDISEEYVRNFSKVSEQSILKHATPEDESEGDSLYSDFNIQPELEGINFQATILTALLNSVLASVPGLVIYLSQDIEFHAPVNVDEELTVYAEVNENLGNHKYRLSTMAISEDQGSVIIDGEAVIFRCST